MRRNLTQRMLCYYMKIECGLDNIRVEELLSLAEIFHVDIADFFDGISLH